MPINNVASVRSRRYVSSDRFDIYASRDKKKLVTLDKKDPEKTYKKDWVKSLKKIDEKKNESEARFKLGIQIDHMESDLMTDAPKN